MALSTPLDPQSYGATVAFGGETGAEARAITLREVYGALDAAPLLRAMIRDEFPGRIAVVSSFGRESAVLLDLVARVDPATPILFLDTGKHFPETLDYRDHLAAHLGLSGVRTIRPAEAALSAEDPAGLLWRSTPDRCCAVRKVAPLDQALTGFSAWITGRKRYQGGGRSRLPAIEAAGGRVKINPLAGWTPDRLRDAFAARGLPEHPLRGEGYESIGCAPCTAKTLPGAPPRSGRWRGSEKTECGIHKGRWLSPD